MPVALKLIVTLRAPVGFVGEIAMELTVASVTVSVVVALTPFSVAVIVAVPFAAAMTRP